MKRIPLTRGLFALVDDADFESLNQFKWYARKEPHTFYACRDVGGRANKKCLGMHRVILDAPKGLEVDHVNYNGLDNRRENLRVCTRSQNLQHRRKFRRPRDTSFHKGVHWHTSGLKWQARICVDGKQKSLGLFGSEREAAKAYNEAALKLFGEFAQLNKIESEVA